MAFRETELRDVIRFGEVDLEDWPNTVADFLFRVGGPVQPLTTPTSIKLKELEGKGRITKHLNTGQRELPDHFMLSYMHCHLFIIFLTDIIKAVFLDDPESPVTRVEVIDYVPNHCTVIGYLTYRLTVKSGHRFVVSFSDRQLGWMEIVRKWEAYELERIRERK